MKIEIGESLAFSWLKHECNCRIVQMNWKKSPQWDSFVTDKEINELFKDAKKYFRIEEIDFTTRKMKSSQLLLQGEVDALGISFDPTRSGVIDNIHAIEIAFHENGLNYGSWEDTINRVCKKYIRTALSIYQSFGLKNGDIYFLTPFIAPKHLNEFKIAIEKLQEFFDNKGFNYKFNLYCNEDFFNHVYLPIRKKSDEISDTFELFIRSLKLINLMEKERNETIVQVKSGSDKLNAPDLKIGLLVRNHMSILSDENLLKATDIENLKSKKFSKDFFDLPYPLLIPDNIDDESCGFDDRGYRRYYPDVYIFDEKSYLLCNHWIDRNNNRDKFLNWYNSIISK
jgi:hypothetical protein